MERIKFILIIYSLQFLFSCNPTSKEQNLQGFYGKVNCLNVEETERINKIKIGAAKILFNKNMTFSITSDSSEFSPIEGTWDLCCRDSDYGNFILTPNGGRTSKTSIPSIYTIINGKEIELVFTVCD